ncbi:hypothetical protein BDN72DRAFT_765518 [Pluteus cervinus]|uniref:Uncharacterized protein n=1 Tax=Pluteus cervinus TaxID=181527 RepID=A0ACD3AYW2_9AGAR|nr:hypothetical protein BDN72DRAFT_765518 [Pluteus cervinus]
MSDPEKKTPEAQFDPDHRFVTSYFISPSALAVIRILIAIYTLVTNLYVLIRLGVRSHEADQFLPYFTNLSYVGQCAYFWAAGVQTIFYVRNDGSGYPLQSWPKVLRYLHRVLFSTTTTYPILVTIVFWILLADASTFATPYSAWANLSRHALNTVFALFEIGLTNGGPLVWIDIVPCVVCLGAYLGVAYITHATQGYYTYSFLDPVKEGKLLAGYIIGIAAGECIIFAIVLGATTLRSRLVNRNKEA